MKHPNQSISNHFEAGMQEDAPDVKKLHSSLDHKFEQSHALFAACCHLNYLVAEYVLIYASKRPPNIYPPVET
ncbi:MAG: hypothetical protein IPN26_10140 [Bacteroidetes bacterium]|nr:hypothetical protein [Bacteroidota bacterium]